MSRPSDILAALHHQGASLSVEGENLIWEAHRGPTEAEVKWIRANKPALIRELNCLRLDFETISTLDLEEVGTAVYVAHPETRVLTLAWCIGTGDVRVWWPGEPIPPDILQAIGAGTVLVSHGPFDRIIWQEKLVPLGWPAVPIERWSDTMARCRAYRVPAKLAKAAERLELGYRKDATGAALIRRATEAARGGPPLTEKELAQFDAYATRDVELLREIDSRVPELSALDDAGYRLTEKLNARGLPVDLRLVRRLHDLWTAEDARLAKKMRELVGLNPTQREKLLSWLHANTVDPPVDMKAEKTLVPWLEGHPQADETVRAVVNTYVEAANSSGSKLSTLLSCTSADGFARGSLVWHGCHTGRWSGRLFQPQNLPRTDDGTMQTLLDLLQPGGPAADSVGKKPRSVKKRIAAVLRTVIRAPEGYRLAVVDFAQVESRILCWLAGQQNMLDAYRRGEDQYIATARQLGSDDRQFGKLMVLAAGFGGGPRMLLAKAPEYGVQLTDTEAEQAVYIWRAANAEIVAFWNALHEAMRSVLEMPVGYEREVQGLVVLHGDDDTLRIRLPSGRSLIYHQPRMEPDEDYEWRFNLIYQQAGPADWQEKKSWRGLAAENVVQAIAYDLMADRMLRMDATGIELVGTVHDEAIALAPEGQADAVLAEMKEIMSTPPDWATGLPLATEGYDNPRYVKP